MVLVVLSIKVCILFFERVVSYGQKIFWAECKKTENWIFVLLRIPPNYLAFPTRVSALLHWVRISKNSVPNISAKVQFFFTPHFGFFLLKSDANQLPHIHPPPIDLVRSGKKNVSLFVLR